MVTNKIDFELLGQQTSKEFVRGIKHAVDYINTWDENEIQFYIEEDEYSISVLMCYFGSVTKHEYRFSTGGIERNQIYWTDIRKFFNIPFEMKKQCS